MFRNGTDYEVESSLGDCATSCLSLVNDCLEVGETAGRVCRVRLVAWFVAVGSQLCPRLVLANV